MIANAPNPAGCAILRGKFEGRGHQSPGACSSPPCRQRSPSILAFQVVVGEAHARYGTRFLVGLVGHGVARLCPSCSLCRLPWLASRCLATQFVAVLLRR
ncbi:MAG: hypothetical protein MZW92_26975 [Comamonadaceae bacterium]|nr:hypothetical protein [Comamonadaceae bacterium]